MAGKQETLIYIEKENKAEAEFMSQSFVNGALKNRAYINALGAELAMKYLHSEGIDVADIYNIHSVSKILEKVDISDVLLPNIHIDVRVVFDENQIFIPKNHFSLEITPDIYMVLKLSPDFNYVELLGYFEPKSINLKNCNSEYYFIEKGKLSPAETLKKFITNFTGNTSIDISQDAMLRGRELSVALADHNISEQEEKELFKLLLSSKELRESVLEFDNFETLSFSVGSSSLLNLPVKNTVAETVSEVENSEETENNTQEDSEEQQNPEEENTLAEEETEIEDSVDAPVIEDIVPQEMENEGIEEDLLQNETTTLESEIQQPETSIQNEELTFDDNLGEDLLLDDNFEIDTLDTSAVETTLTETLDTAETDSDSSVEEPDLEKETPSLEKTVGDAVQNVLKKTAETAAAAGTIAAAGAGAAAAATGAEALATGAATGEAIKLAGISGELVNDLINKNIEEQQTNLDKIDYAKTTHGASTEEIPEHVAAFDLSAAKMEANLEAEISGQFEGPTDLSELKTVETKNLGYGEIVQETVDFSKMDTVETDEIKEDIEDTVNLNNLSSIDSPTKPVDNLEDKLVDDSKYLGMDMPNMSTYTIDADGSSPFDAMDIHLEENNEEHLVDFNMNANEFNLDNIEDMNLDSVESTENMLTFENNYNLNLSSEDAIPLDEDVMNPKTAESHLPITEDLQEEVPLDSTELVETIDQLPKTPLDETIESFDEPMDDITEEEQTFTNEQAIEHDEISQENTDLSDEIPQNDEIIYDDEISAEDLLNELEAGNSNEENANAENLADEEIVEENNSTETAFDNDLTIEEELDGQNPETVSDAQEWLDDTNYDNLQDAEIPQPEEIIEGDLITEPEPEGEKTFAVAENSVVISDKNFNIGEIHIDINNNNAPLLEGPEQLEQLYNNDNNVPGGAILKTPGTLGSGRKQGGNPALGVGLGIVGVLLALIIVGVIGFTVSKMIKQPVEETPQPITDDAIPTNSDNGVSETNTLTVNPDNVVNMDNNTNTPAVPAAKKPVQQTAKPAAAAVSAPQQQKKSLPETSFIEVRKLTWEVPDYISYNQNFKQYFQAAGKSLKLSLTSDLLLATEYIYSDQVRVSITYDKDGTFKNTRILLSSGSSQVDNIVLQTVNQTLKVLKAPPSVGNDESTTVILKIYF